MSDAGFNRVSHGPETTRQTDEPRLSVYPDGSGRVNVAAEEYWFEGVDTVEFYYDAESDDLGIALGGDRDEAGYAAPPKDTPGRKLSLRSALNTAGIDWTALDGAVHLPLTHDHDAGLLVADLTPVREAAR